MLLEYGAKNFFSFNEGFEASLRLNNKCPENISKGKNFAKVQVVKGANGSGKTNVLKVLSFLSDFCTNSFNLKPDEKINAVPFFKNTEPSEFFIVFKIDNVEYRYELVVSQEKVFSETIYQKQKRYVKVVERKNNLLEKKTNQYSDMKAIVIRNNASIISTGHQYEIKSINKIYMFFFSIISNVNHWGLSKVGPDIDTVSQLYFKDKEMFTFINEIIKDCDVGIDKIKILDIEDEKGNKKYFPIFYHDCGGIIESLTIHFQSSGTKALYQFLILYKIVLRLGGVLVLDEFDINLHPHILPKLIDLFENDDINKNNAQLVFTTHNTDIIDILGKYRTTIVKKEINNSFVYRLDELPGDIVRNDRPISPIYNSGKIGGIPRL